MMRSASTVIALGILLAILAYGITAYLSEIPQQKVAELQTAITEKEKETTTITKAGIQPEAPAAKPQKTTKQMEGFTVEGEETIREDKNEFEKTVIIIDTTFILTIIIAILVAAVVYVASHKIYG